MTYIAAAEYSQEQAISRGARRGAVKEPLKTSRTTATLKRRALKKKVSKLPKD